MSFVESFKNDLFSTSRLNFKEKALALFQFQAKELPVYQSFLNYLHINPFEVQSLEEIPFLPISFFKSQQLVCNSTLKIEKVFESSGTTGDQTSKHHVLDLKFYERVSRNIFEKRFGSIYDYDFLALLPSYVERQNSSLVHMVNYFILASQSTESGFYIQDFESLLKKIEYLKKNGKRKIILIGVSFALLDLAEQYKPDLSGVILIETGGMKGKREEITKNELYAILKSNLNVSHIDSEYGMTELLSQAYTVEEEILKCPPWMKTMIRELEDPFSYKQDKQGGINIVDLANVESCAFIATQDIGINLSEDTFKVLGRVDHSDVRGCNLMYF
jgi:phenylacetate-coenzyme A ligase PaaK-like adenylate-forming protein